MYVRSGNLNILQHIHTQRDLSVTCDGQSENGAYDFLLLYITFVVVVVDESGTTCRN